MIIQPIDDYKWNEEFQRNIEKAKAYIRRHYIDLKVLPVGVTRLDDQICEGAFVNVMEYMNKDNPPWESHKKYVDIQIIFEGEEDFLIANTNTLKPKDYQVDSDYHDWEGEATHRITLRKGEILILLPYDAHRVGLPTKNGKTFVKKAILKIPYKQ